jgi:hypothetical protein
MTDCTLPLAEGARAHERGAAVVLQRAGEDLRGAGAVLVHEHHDGERRARARGVRAGLVLRGAVAPPGRDDDPALQELVGHEDRLVEQPAGVVAEVQHEALEAPAGLAGERVEGAVDLDAGAVLKALEGDVAHALGEHPRLHAAHPHHLAHEGQSQRIGDPAAPQHHPHPRARRAAHAPHGLVDVEPPGVAPLDGEQLVPPPAPPRARRANWGWAR